MPGGRVARVLVAAGGLVLVLTGLAAGVAGAAQTEPPPAPEPPVSRTNITARLFDDSKKSQDPVVGVRVVVRFEGEVVGEAVSDDKGVAIIPLTQGGTYDIRLDPKTYPKGVAPPPEERLANAVVQEGRPKFVIFPFGQTEATEPGAVDRLADLFASGIRVGLVIALASVGLSLVFSTTGLINFAEGELVTFGAIAAFLLNAEGSDGLGLTLVVAGVLAVILGGGFGAALDAVLWKPLRRRRTGNVALIVVSIGLALLLRSFFQIVFGAEPRSYAQYATQRDWDLGPLDLAPKDVASIAICLVLLVAIACFLLFTRSGTAIRAVADEPDLAESSGIDVERVIRIAWTLCGALSAAAGVLLGLTFTVEYDTGFQFLLVIFAAMILGGLGSVWGAMLGGVVLGVVFDVSTYWIATDFKNAMILGVLILTLLVRPQGILGSRERVG